MYNIIIKKNINNKNNVNIINRMPKKSKFLR